MHTVVVLYIVFLNHIFSTCILIMSTYGPLSRKQNHSLSISVIHHSSGNTKYGKLAEHFWETLTFSRCMHHFTESGTPIYPQTSKDATGRNRQGVPPKFLICASKRITSFCHCSICDWFMAVGNSTDICLDLKQNIKKKSVIKKSIHWTCYHYMLSANYIFVTL